MKQCPLCTHKANILNYSEQTVSLQRHQLQTECMFNERVMPMCCAIGCNGTPDLTVLHRRINGYNTSHSLFARCSTYAV
jgi:hypothetical protein